MQQVVERGIERGDLRANTDVRLALDLLSGPLLLRALITGAPIDERLVRGVTDAVLAAFAP